MSEAQLKNVLQSGHVQGEREGCISDISFIKIFAVESGSAGTDGQARSEGGIMAVHHIIRCAKKHFTINNPFRRNRHVQCNGCELIHLLSRH